MKIISYLIYFDIYFNQVTEYRKLSNNISNDLVIRFHSYLKVRKKKIVKLNKNLKFTVLSQKKRRLLEKWLLNEHGKT